MPLRIFGETQEKAAALDEVEDLFEQAFEKLHSVCDEPEFDELLDENHGQCEDLIKEIRQQLHILEDPPWEEMLNLEEEEGEEGKEEEEGRGSFNR